MNYRHAYHAGNFADVVKHAVLALVIDYFKQKPKPFTVIDTHAGCGVYDTSSVESRKTGEFETGVGKVLGVAGSAPALLAPYLNILTHVRQGGTLMPGSPLISAHLLRAGDDLHAVELHPQDVEKLHHALRQFSCAHVHHRDGYEALQAMIPPKTKRGIVLIDPPFEQPDEFTTLAQTLSAAYTKWPTGCYVVWFPIKTLAAVQKFYNGLKAQVVPYSALEFFIRTAADDTQLNGCGLLFINPPHVLKNQVAEIMPWLTRVLSSEKGAGWKWREGA